MSVIIWTERFKTGISIIDSQHRILVGMINQVHEASLEKDPAHKNLVLKIDLQHLIEYTIYHFETEEKLLKEINFPGLAAHHEEHEKLKKEVMDFVDQFNRGEEIIESLLKFLKYWLQFHILKTDMEFVAEVKKHEAR
jgi:methyl-accepting chemotaxis protein/hemerythrin